jgi:AraC-like DNA-binding protein
MDPLETVDFNRTKYGPEILVDVVWVHDIPTFILDRPHRLKFYEIILVTRGTGAGWLDADRIAIRPGQVVFTRPGQIRRWQVRGLDGICLLFPALFLDQFFQDPEFLARLPFFGARRRAQTLALSEQRARMLRRSLLGMRRELQKPRGDSTHLLRARLYEALIHLDRWFSTAHRLGPVPDPHPVVEKFRLLLDRDIGREHRVEMYAKAVAVTPGHLNVLCHQQFGMSAKAVIQERLVLEARRLLLYTDESAGRIADQLGFQNPSYFSRFFRRVAGRSPLAFRAGPLG